MSEVWVASLVALWVVVMLMGFLLAGALREIGIIQLRVGDDPGALITDDGLDRGTMAPDFEAIDPDSGAIRQFSKLAKVSRMVVFVTPSCLACRLLVPHLNEMMATRAKEVDLLTVCTGDRESCQSFQHMSGLKAQMFVDDSGRVAKAYKANATPFTYLLDHEGRVLMRGIANDWRGLESILEQEGTLEAGRLWNSVKPVESAASPADSVNAVVESKVP